MYSLSTTFNLVNSNCIRSEIEKIKEELTEQWENNETFDLEMQLVVNTVAFAILNPG